MLQEPVVRAEDLAFKQKDVLQVLKTVFNPWYHAYRLFVQSAINQEAQTGAPFRQDTAMALASPQMERLVLTLPPGELTDLDDTTAGFLRYRMQHFEHVK